jgi:hypothetical protein
VLFGEVPRGIGRQVAAATAGLVTFGLVTAGCGGSNATQPAGGEFSETLTFNSAPVGSDPTPGQATFGLASDGIHGDSSQALFEGFSQRAGKTITSNGRTCFSCHRPEANFMINPLLPLDQHLAADDPLIDPAAVVADSAGNPDAAQLLNDFGLVLHRPHRFDAQPDDPRFQAFAFRKVLTNLNLVFAHGFLNDLRTASLPSTDVGAAMAHTQDGNDDFSDLILSAALDDLAAFQFTLFTQPELRPLAAGPNDPGYARLASDPYATVPTTMPEQERGRAVFDQNCFPCHNVPNVFNNRSHRDPAFGIPIGQAFNIGVAEANMLGLDFRNYDPATGQRQVVNLPLVDAAGATVIVSLNQDPGLALTTGWLEDLGKFKVPQLRNLRLGKPYFHDCSAPDLAAVIDYFDSDDYRQSVDGRRYPITMTPQDKSDLLSFLMLL